MTEGKVRKETALINDEQENEKTRGSAELADAEPNRTDLQSDEQPGSDDIYELPTLFSLSTLSYEGETCDGQFHGEGVARFEGGLVYKGMFNKGLMDGHGVLTWASGMKYEGEFVSNVPMGQGVYTWPNGSSYKGEVYNGVRHGTGIYKCGKSDVSYTGQWYQGKRHGKGAVHYNQDKTSWYKGDWVRNNREGVGVRCYPSGNVYRGEWKNNLRHGEGTMRWLKLGQQYVGTWQEGIQHGRGTHVWILRRADGSQYSQSNQYTGDFVQGQRHGHGTFSYAGGAVYEGEWKNNKKHGKAKFTFKDGHVFEGEFADDQMMTPSLNGNRAPTPLCGALLLSGSDSSVLGPDMTLNIRCLLDKIPERKHRAERKQVEFVVLRTATELRSVYSFYSRLGHTRSPDNTFLLSRLQLWRLLKDCYIHHHDITLAQIDHFIKEPTATEIHSPFTPVPLHRLLSCLAIVAYHIYNKDMATEKYLLAACLSKLMTDDILPNAKNVKGFLFQQPDLSAVAATYMERCWEAYQAYCRVHAAPRDDQSMTGRHLLWMFKDLHLLDDKLTTARLVKMVTAESLDPSDPSSCLALEITFLEFFEVLLGSAEVKCAKISDGPEESSSGFTAEARRDLPQVEASQKTLQTTCSPSHSTGIPGDSAESSSAQDIMQSQRDVETEVKEQPKPAEHAAEGSRMQSRGAEAKEQTVHHFFNRFFLPAFDHYQLVTKYMEEEKLRQEAQLHPSGTRRDRGTDDGGRCADNVCSSET